MTENGAASGNTTDENAGIQTTGMEKKSSTKKILALLNMKSSKEGKETSSKVELKALPKNTAFCRKQLNDGSWIFDQEIGTKLSAVGRRFISYISFTDEGCETGKWVLGTITSRGEKKVSGNQK